MNLNYPCSLAPSLVPINPSTERMCPQHEVWTDRSALRLWASHVRTMVAAFQRRGESDAVAHSLYQLMSLDTETPEWEWALAAPEIQANSEQI